MHVPHIPSPLPFNHNDTTRRFRLLYTEIFRVSTAMASSRFQFKSLRNVFRKKASGSSVDESCPVSSLDRHTNPTINPGAPARPPQSSQILSQSQSKIPADKTHLSTPPPDQTQFNAAPPSVASDTRSNAAGQVTLPLFTKEMLDACPRLRVLVVGKSGVGKSSLISYTFGVDMKSISHTERGTSDINAEIIFSQNDRFVLHDSMGFESGDVKNLETVKSFLRARSGQNIALDQRVHAIWLCIQIPHAGGRVFEHGDEELLKFASQKQVPVVIVFTQHDKLVASLQKDAPATPGGNISEILERCAQTADSMFHDLCLAPLHRLNIEFHVKLEWARTAGLSGKRYAKPDRRALDHLIQVTRKLIERDIEGEAWIVSAMAQRASAQVKIIAAIQIGMKRYWQGLSASTQFRGFTLEKCLDAVHVEMTDSWNFYDPNDLLLAKAFKDEIKILAQLVTPDENQLQSLFDHFNLDAIQSWLGLAVSATIAAAAGPAIVGIGLTVWFTKFIANIYQQTPEALRCFMGYIVDLTLVLNELFLVVIAIRPPRALKDEDLEFAFQNYKNSDLSLVHREIRQYVRDANWGKLLQSDAAELKVKELILKYSSPDKRANNAL
ncbi:hypothetical protein C8R45DRAFT_1222591 [Mycena sanguinolenta]|nr:hypothetical protein C8R45DRAFT_1222591 [Mycena sanguinolenta]